MRSARCAGPRAQKEAASPPLIFLARRAGYGAAPPASRVLRIALRATALRAALDPGDHCGPWGQEERQAQACPRAARGAQTRRWRATAASRTPGETGELAFDSQKERENYKPRVVSRIKRGRSVKDQVRLDTRVDKGRSGSTKRRYAVRPRTELAGLMFVSPVG